MSVTKKIIIVIVILLIIIVMSIAFINQKNKNVESEYNEKISENTTIEESPNIGTQNEIQNTNSAEENEKISKLKEKYGFTGENSIYSQGNEELSIKSSIAYRTALIGSLKQSKPTYEEINNTIVEGEPTKTGIWVTPSSRERFINCINDVENSFKIDNDGYLTIDSNPNGEYSKKIKDIIQKETLIIVDMTGIDYIIDIVTGNIFKNEFEAMDPYQIYEYYDYKEENKSIIILNSNKMKKITNQEIIDKMIDVI